MYCYNCGKTFHANEIVRKFDWDTGPSYCCPHCGVDDIAETQECAICGEEFVEGEIADGYCLSCLWNAIDYDVALDYMKDTNNLGTFLVTVWYDAGRLEHSSIEFDRFLEETFLRLVANDKFFLIAGIERHDFLDACRYFCLPDKDRNEFGADGHSFAEWYARRERIKKEDKK